MLDQQQFKKIASHWASGVAIVSAAGGAEGASGLTITSVTSLSLDPPQYLICLDQKSATLAAIRESGMFCINYLKHTQQAVSQVFATKMRWRSSNARSIPSTRAATTRSSLAMSCPPSPKAVIPWSISGAGTAN